MTPDRTLHSLDEVRAVLKRITFAPSCVDMGWRWEIRSVYGEGVDPHPIGWNVRTTFQRPDTNTGAIETGHGRWWFIEYDTTVSGLVKTAFAAAKMILEHEIAEAFLFEGARIFDPHNTVAELASLQTGGKR